MTLQCVIHFTDRNEQSKAFNYLIHSRIGFSGIDRDTIMLKESDCIGLDNLNIKYEKRKP